MSDTPTEPRFVTCRCQHCDGHIEFDATSLSLGEIPKAQCPHCKSETALCILIDALGKPLTSRLSLITKIEADKFLEAIFRTQKPCDNPYAFTFGPGLVRYVNPPSFWKADIEKLIAAVKFYSKNPEINTPQNYAAGWEHHASKERPIFNSNHLDGFMEGETWDNKLRVHHSFGQYFLTKSLPSHVYFIFHFLLQLEKQFEFEQCHSSWIPNALYDKDLAASFKNSENHVVIFSKKCRTHGAFYVFNKTSFVKERLLLVSNKADEREAAEDAEKLKRSGYSTYIYLMEDLRNGATKIGKSITPGKRERTLQSEEPKIVMRFSIPADESLENQMHQHFDSKNLRGEWFSLNSDDLIWLISKLRNLGDTERAFVDYQWLGKIFFKSKSPQ